MISRLARTAFPLLVLVACNKPERTDHFTSASAPMNHPQKPPPAATTSAVGFETEGVVLYQPDAVLAARISGAHDLAEYIMKLQAVCVAHFRDANVPEALDVVVAL